jgi:heme/copper-type cytochrome/quinol oxidase subunit 3
MSAMAVAEHSHEDRVFTHQPLGKVGVWWFLASEIMVFGGLIGTYILSRIGHGGWEVERAHVSATMAVINTAVLVTSSLSVVQAHAAAEANDRRRARMFLLLTVILGSVFLMNKGIEYSREFGHGFTPASGLFWSFYYTMTGLHGLHVLVGVIVNFVLWLALTETAWAAIKHRVEYVGLYWHFVDVVWIFLFPLLYLS